MKAKSQASGELVLRRFATVAAVACGVLMGLCIVGRAARGDDRTDKAVERGLAFLAAHQADDGSYGSEVYRGHVAVTAFACRAMMASGSKPGEGRYGKQLSHGLNYLLGRIQKSGLITSKRSEEPAPMYGHGFALLFLAECQKAAPRTRQKRRSSGR